MLGRNANADSHALGRGYGDATASPYRHMVGRTGRSAGDSANERSDDCGSRYPHRIGSWGESSRFWGTFSITKPTPALVTVVGLAFVFWAVVARAAPGGVSIRWIANAVAAGRVVVEVHGLDSKTLGSGSARKEAGEWQRLLSVFAGQGSIQADLDTPPMLGDYKVADRVLCFEPRFPLERGVTYRAVLRTKSLLPGRDEAALSSTFQLPAEPRPASTKVESIHPSADLLPENLLKFYVRFSAPMSRGHIYDHIRLLNQSGLAVELPFLEIDEELWDPEMKRLTLFIDPGRIKRGVKPLEELGPALEEGKAFTLVIDPAWHDADGAPLVEKFEKRFRVGPPDRTPPDPAGWNIQAPAAGTTNSLRVEFPEAMDHALAQRMIRVVDGAGKTLAGRATLENQERRWLFTPTVNWRHGTHQLVVPTTIEDLAGNNVGKPFEVDLFENVQRRVTSESVRRPFEIR